MKLLITGGAGFIGSHLCEKYTQAGHTVVCLDNFLSGNLMNVRHLLDYRNFKLVKGDIRDFDLLEKLMRDVEVVFHLAAQVHVDRSYIEPRLTYDINVLGTQNVLEAARLYDTRKIIYASSSEVYGSALQVPINELHPLNAPHPYGASKIAADRMCYAYIQTYGMDITIVRSFNVFGPRQRDLGYGGVISIFTRRVLSNVPPMIYGDGRQTRDYTYVEDTVNAYDLILHHPDPIPEPINFGTGSEISILDLATMIIEFCGKKGQIEPVYVGPRIGEVNRLIADATKARQLLGWVPTYTFETGLQAYIEWYKKYGFDEKLKID
ncbi:MAG TPA: GDP-mannose 4,6-dehydratase [Anaerolineae bacterium]|nr:GDP-mannose 4,6-dehydratase [Anaerolineae bacterium]HQH37343.1 GDP-mannose 4,6-dehydratase [Anaerolineae bacterium]